MEVGNSQRRVNLKQSRHQSLRFLVSPGKRTACSGDTQCWVANRLLSQCHLCPCESFIIAASKEMSVRSPLLHTKEDRIDRAQTHSVCKALDSPIWFAEPHFDPAASRPPPGQVRIDQQGSINEGGAIIEISGDIRERVAGVTEYGSIVLA